MMKFSEYKEKHGVSTKANGEPVPDTILLKAPEINLSYLKYLSIFKGNRNKLINIAIDRLIDDIEKDILKF